MQLCLDEILRRSGAATEPIVGALIAADEPVDSIHRALCTHIRELRGDSFQQLFDAYTGAVDEHLASTSNDKFTVESLLAAARALLNSFHLIAIGAQTFMTRSAARLDVTGALDLADRFIRTVNRSIDGSFGNIESAVRHNIGDIMRLRAVTFDGLGHVTRATFVVGGRERIGDLARAHRADNVELFFISLAAAGNIFTRTDDYLAHWLDHAIDDALLYFDDAALTAKSRYFFRATLRLLLVADRLEDAERHGEHYWAVDGAPPFGHDDPTLQLLCNLPAHAGRVIDTYRRRVDRTSHDDAEMRARLSATLSSVYLDHGDFDRARDLLSGLSTEIGNGAVFRLMATNLLRLGDVDGARSCSMAAHQRCTDSYLASPHDAGALSQLIASEDLGHLLDFYEQTRSAIAPSAVIAARNWWDTVERECEPRSAADDLEVVVGSVESCLNSIGLATFPLGLLTARGAHVAPVSTADLGFPSTRTRRTLDHSAIANEGRRAHPTELHLDWEIDLPAGRASCLGIDLYQSIFERLARMLRTFRVDFEARYVRRVARILIQRCDRTLYFLQALHDDAAQRGRRVVLTALQPQFAPWSAFRLYASRHPDRFRFVHITSAYENWLDNRSAGSAGTIAMVDQTRHPDVRTATFGTAERFTGFLDSTMADFAAEGAAAELLRLDRTRQAVQRPGGGLVAEWVRRARDAHEQGRWVFCALGKIPYDLAVPSMGGPAHDDIADWINHTVRCVRSSHDLLIIKPHPHEVRDSIAQCPTETFTDLIDGELPDNVVVLDHLEASVQDLIPVTNVFLVWNGSAVLEVGGSGKPVVACDEWAPRDYPVGLATPPDRATYEAWLRSPTSIPIARRPELCRAYAEFLRSDWVAVAHPWLQRSSSNIDFNRPEYLLDQVDYAAAGSTRAILRQLEAFTGPAPPGQSPPNG